MMLKLFDYWRSSASYRVRIALNLKGADYETVPVNLAPDADEHLSEAYRQTNPQMRVPALEIDGTVVTQSMAIIEWIDETLPGPALLPADPLDRLRARAFADTIACDVHPLNNLSVLKELRSTFGADDAALKTWYHDWIRRGFAALERYANDRLKGRFLFGDAPGIAEITLVPQIYNARRFEMDLSAFPTLMELDVRCAELDAFQRAFPKAPA